MMLLEKTVLSFLRRTMMPRKVFVVAAEAVMLALLSACLTGSASAQVVAFPGAVGYGASATGGRGGTVVHVTNLNDTGAGSLRAAVSASNRIVVFDVGGYIQLQSPLSVSSDITIAGQTAPGGGIGTFGSEVSFSNASNIIMRYFRVRDGTLDANYNGSSPDSHTNGINMDASNNIILDHVSIEFAAYNGIDAVGSDCNITVQNCILADPIGQQFNAHTEDIGGHFTWYNTIFANGHNRNPLAKMDTQFVNNVLYDFAAGFTAGNTETPFSDDLVNNYFIAGQSTTDPKDVFYQMGPNNGKYQSVYVHGNLYDDNADGTLSGNGEGQPDGTTTLTAPWSPTTALLATTNASDALARDIANAGDLPRDPEDTLVVGYVMSFGKTGRIIGNQATDTGLNNDGYGTINGGPMLQNTTGDGIPDVWKEKYGLPVYSSEANGDFDKTGYTNIEKYINGIVDGSYPLATPVSLAAQYTVTGITNNGSGNATGLNGQGNTYSSFYLNGSVVANGLLYNLGTPGSVNTVRCAGQSLTLPSGSFATLTFLGAATQANLPSQVFVVHYTDGTSDTFTQGMSLLTTPQSYTGETVALTMAYKNSNAGAQIIAPCYLYQYSFTLNSKKTVSSVTLPTGSGSVILGMDVIPAPPSAIVLGGGYKLVPENAMGDGTGGVDEVMDVPGGSNVSGTNVDISSDTGGTGQDWTITDGGNGYYRLSPVCAPANALDVVGASNGAAHVDSAAWTGGAGQLWQILGLGGGYYELIPQSGATTGTALEVGGDKTTDGTLVETATYTAANNQFWKLELESVPVQSGAAYTIAPENALGKGTGGVDEVVNVSGASAASGAAVDIASSNGGNQQQWAITNTGSGLYRISALCAPANALGSTGTGNSNSDSETWTDSPNQLWQIIDVGGGYFSIIPRSPTGKSLDIVGQHTADGTIVDVYTYGNGTNQRWKFTQLTAIPSLPSLSGAAALQGWTGAPQPLVCTLTPRNNTTGAPITQTVTPGANGSFTLTNVPFGTYTLSIKGSRWLQKDIAIDATGGSVSGISMTLLPGDLNGDNQVSISDLARLRAAYGATPTSANWNASADLNGDGIVDASDLALLQANYGKRGDP